MRLLSAKQRVVLTLKHSDNYQLILIIIDIDCGGTTANVVLRTKLSLGFEINKTFRIVFNFSSRNERSANRVLAINTTITPDRFIVNPMLFQHRFS